MVCKKCGETNPEQLLGRGDICIFCMIDKDIKREEEDKKTNGFTCSHCGKYLEIK